MSLKRKKDALSKIYGRRNKSSIIHQINKENKQAYKQRIIERNKRAREASMKAAEEDKSQPPSTFTQKGKVEKKKQPETNKDKDEFADIGKAENPERVKDYDSKAQNKVSYNDPKHKYLIGEDSKNDSPLVEKRFKSTTSPSKSSKFKSTGGVKFDTGKSDLSSLDENSLERDSSYVSVESDINDRDDWKMNNDIALKRDITNNHIDRMEKSSPSELPEESDNN